jgi:lipopolysaccharide export system permease protein
VELHRRTAESGTIIILTLIGMIVASRKVRGGLGLHLALGISLGAIFVFLSRFSVTFATNQSLNPILGVWLPNIIFMGVAIYLFTKAQR